MKMIIQGDESQPDDEEFTTFFAVAIASDGKVRSFIQTIDDLQAHTSLAIQGAIVTGELAKTLMPEV